MLWPFIMLAMKTTQANRAMIRWAVRNRAGPIYVFAIFWAPSLTLGLLIWALISAHVSPGTAWPLLTIILFLINKTLALLYFLMQQASRMSKAVRHYRRHFR